MIVLLLLCWLLAKLLPRPLISSGPLFFTCGPWLLGVAAVTVVCHRRLCFLVACFVIWWLRAANLGTGSFPYLGIVSALVMEQVRWRSSLASLGGTLRTGDVSLWAGCSSVLGLRWTAFFVSCTSCLSWLISSVMPLLSIPPIALVQSDIACITFSAHVNIGFVVCL